MSSIRTRLLGLLLTGLLAILLLGGGGLYWVVRTHVLAELDASLESRAASLTALVFTEGDSIELEFNGEIGASMGVLFSITDPSGRVLACSPGLTGHPLPSLLRDGETRAWGDVELPGDVDGRALTLAFLPRAEEEGAGHHAAPSDPPPRLVATVAVSREGTDRALATVLGALVLVGAALIAATIALVWGGVRVGLAPLDRLSARLRRIDAAHMDARADAGGVPIELRPVYDELNRLLDRIEQALARERRFTDAAAHELRTPIAELRTGAEVALRWNDAERSASALREAVGIAAEMEQLVESFLLISRGDVVAMDDARPIRVAPIVEKCIAGVRENAAARAVGVRSSLAPDARWRIPEHAAETIVRNLVENAVQYTPAHGSIGVELSSSPDAGTRLVVENGPVELTPEQIPYLTEPFWRADHARSERAHRGIGLTIVRHFAEVAGLVLEVTLEPGAILRVGISQPPESETHPGKVRSE